MGNFTSWLKPCFPLAGAQVRPCRLSCAAPLTWHRRVGHPPSSAKGSGMLRVVVRERGRLRVDGATIVKCLTRRTQEAVERRRKALAGHSALPRRAVRRFNPTKACFRLRRGGLNTVKGSESAQLGSQSHDRKDDHNRPDAAADNCRNHPEQLRGQA